MIRYYTQRIRYLSGRITLLQEPIVKGTYVSFDDNLIQYSYLRKGVIEPIYNCEPFTNKMWYAGEFHRMRDIIDLKGQCIRYVAVHEDGELNCFVSHKHTPSMSLHQCDGSIDIEPNTHCIVMEGELRLQQKVAKQFVMVNARDHIITLEGKGKLVKIKF